MDDDTRVEAPELVRELRQAVGAAASNTGRAIDLVALGRGVAARRGLLRWAWQCRRGRREIGWPPHCAARRHRGGHLATPPERIADCLQLFGPRPGIPRLSQDSRTTRVFTVNRCRNRKPRTSVFVLVSGRKCWCPRGDSNARTRLRRPMLYPLSYEGKMRAAG